MSTTRRDVIRLGGAVALGGALTATGTASAGSVAPLPAPSSTVEVLQQGAFLVYLDGRLQTTVTAVEGLSAAPVHVTARVTIDGSARFAARRGPGVSVTLRRSWNYEDTSWSDWAGAVTTADPVATARTLVIDARDVIRNATVVRLDLGLVVPTGWAGPSFLAGSTQGLTEGITLISADVSVDPF